MRPHGAGPKATPEALPQATDILLPDHLGDIVASNRKALTSHDCAVASQIIVVVRHQEPVQAFLGSLQDRIADLKGDLAVAIVVYRLRDQRKISVQVEVVVVQSAVRECWLGGLTPICHRSATYTDEYALRSARG